jgi:hypothetical protein
MNDTTLPAAGTEAVYRGQNVTVTATKKRGRGWQVHYQRADGARLRARLKDWARGVQ